MVKIISGGTRIPYDFNDLGVVIPHGQKSVERIKWFLPQYVAATPPEVVANTYIATDPDDLFTPKFAKEYGVKVVFSKGAWITPKLQAGYELLRTRLCARIHNDVAIHRKDWAEVLIKQFNSFEIPQLIGQLHGTGDFLITEIFKYFEDKPYFNKLKERFEIISRETGDIIGTEYLHGFFMASQTYILRDIQYSILDWEDGGRSKDDCVISLFAFLNRIQVVDWLNITSYLSHVGKAGGRLVDGIVATEIEESSRKPIFNFKKAEET